MSDSSPSKPIEVLNATIFAYWTFKGSHPECPICKEKLETSCIVCQSQKSSNNVCNVSRGKCGHTFHKHCIDSWLTKQKSYPICPVCKTPYATDIDNLGNDEDWKKLLSKKT